MRVGLGLVACTALLRSRPISVRTRPLTMKDDGDKQCDYLVVGAGASGMAFVDSLLLGCKLPTVSVTSV